MKYTAFAFQLTSDSVIAHLKNDSASFEFAIPRQDFEAYITDDSGEYVNGSFFYTEGQDEREVPLSIEIEKYWQHAEVDDRVILSHIDLFLKERISESELQSAELEQKILAYVPEKDLDMVKFYLTGYKSLHAVRGMDLAKEVNILGQETNKAA